MSNITPKSTAEEMTIAGNIYEAGNSLKFKTGDWRSQKPIFLSEKCKQCGLCFPVCPDDAIPVNKKEKISIMIIAKVAECVLKFVRLVQSKWNKTN